MEPVPKKSSGCRIYDRYHKGKLTCGGAADDQLAGEDLLAYGLTGAFNTTNHLFYSSIANLPGGLFEGGNADASQLRPLQFIKPQQTDIAAPVQANTP